MDYLSLELNLAQLHRSIQKTKTNKYSDIRKESYQTTLLELYEKLSNEDFSTMSLLEIIDRKKIIDFTFQSIQYLDNSTLTITPFEIIFCLEKILSFWIPQHNYIIVTSLDNNLNSYEINYSLTLKEPIHQLIEDRYGITFGFRLIQIRMPRYYVHDYFANVALYHELGHFVDSKYEVSKKYVISSHIYDQTISPEANGAKMTKRYYHCMEHFADIFASQYIGDSICLSLNYVSHNHSSSETHPATAIRITKVEAFLSGVTTDQLVTDILAQTKILCSHDLEIRFKDLPLDDFDNLIPMEIDTDVDLHSVILAGWKFWRRRPNSLIEKLGKNIVYKIINNLIEKSISNYIIKQNWNN